MSYDPLTDFVALLRRAATGAEFARMPGLDYVVSAMSRAGMFTLYVGQTMPVVNQALTVWLLPSLPSWVAEGTIFLWNSATQRYELATPSLWNALLSPSGYAFQAVSGASNTVQDGTSLLAVERVNPATTSLMLPRLATRQSKKLQIVDWSTTLSNHEITLVTADNATIMRETSWTLLSNANQRAGISLQPSPELNGWVIVP